MDQNYLIGAFKPSCNISITFSDAKNRKQVPMKKENGQTLMVPLFHSQENIAGKISIEPLQGKKVDQVGVKVELLGQIEMYFDRGNFYDFASLVRELDVPGEIYERKTYPFEFSTVEMPYETYNGVNVRLRYVLKVTVTRAYAGSIIEYQDFVARVIQVWQDNEICNLKILVPVVAGLCVELWLLISKGAFPVECG
uniref:Vacuolar protein sorting 26 n=1 Tax=Populus alba TaxID=43335 RepID=A0A4U5PWP6_POPAL|nr:Vacuolar protein sorting 26 [Populus alba]